MRWRDACEVFAVFAAVRSRARSIARSCLGGSFAGTSDDDDDDDDDDGVGSSDEAAARRSVAAIAGCVVLIAAWTSRRRGGVRVADFLLGDVDAVASFDDGRSSYRGDRRRAVRVPRRDVHDVVVLSRWADTSSAPTRSGSRTDRRSA